MWAGGIEFACACRRRAKKMHKTNIMDLSFIRWADLKPFFISPDQEDLNLANDILERHEVYADKLEDL